MDGRDVVQWDDGCCLLCRGFICGITLPQQKLGLSSESLTVFPLSQRWSLLAVTTCRRKRSWLQVSRNRGRVTAPVPAPALTVKYLLCKIQKESTARVLSPVECGFQGWAGLMKRPGQGEEHTPRFGDAASG